MYIVVSLTWRRNEIIISAQMLLHKKTLLVPNNRAKKIRLDNEETSHNLEGHCSKQNAPRKPYPW